MRVAVLREDNCQPKKCNSECHTYCPPVRTDRSASSSMTERGNPTSPNPSALDVHLCEQMSP